jgi:hypothetical protein
MLNQTVDVMYARARDQAQWSLLRSALTRRPHHLLALGEVNASCTVHAHRDAGVRTVPIRQIRGSESRCTDFDRDFNPLQDHSRERWLHIARAGVLVALALFCCQRRTNHFLAIPGILVAFIILFYLGLLVTGTSITEAINHGLLLGEVSGKATWQPLALGELLAADWGGHPGAEWQYRRHSRRGRGQFADERFCP